MAELLLVAYLATTCVGPLWILLLVDRRRRGTVASRALQELGRGHETGGAVIVDLGGDPRVTAEPLMSGRHVARLRVPGAVFGRDRFLATARGVRAPNDDVRRALASPAVAAALERALFHASCIVLTEDGVLSAWMPMSRIELAREGAGLRSSVRDLADDLRSLTRALRSASVGRALEAGTGAPSGDPVPLPFGTDA